jgi:NADH-quinone oxidoreductase subunit F
MSEAAVSPAFLDRAALAALRARLAAHLRARAGEEASASAPREVLVCAGGACISCHSPAVADEIEDALAASALAGRVRVVRVGCMGLCEAGPLVVVSPDGVYYANVDAAGAHRIVTEHLVGGRVVHDLELASTNAAGDRVTGRDIPFFARQVKIALRNCGVIDPASIEDYVARDGYLALERTLFELHPDGVIDAVKRSGLRGRGGAGFPTGMKWELVREAQGNEKFVVCNGDEGDPGAFMDRSLLESDPHSIIEGMTIAGRVVGARRGFVYVRAEYPLAIERLGEAFAAAREAGLLGPDILGSGFAFDIEIRIGAGAFVCGEETALLRSIEGKRGTPQPRPPFPAQQGLWGKPTLINNVETWANVAPILLRGPEWFAGIGTGRSKGTKVFALAGAIRNTGLVEVPMGISLRTIVEEIGGGIPNGRHLKAAQSGGPSGGCVPATAADVPIDYESLQELGAIMGSGGLIILDDRTCMVGLARFFLEFLVDESCGKCPPCRIGTRVMLNLLDRITRGEGSTADLDTLESLGQHIRQTSLCGLGQTASNAVLSTLRHFRAEYLEHIEEKHCRACSCPGLVTAPCSHACPAGVDVPRYVRAIAQERFGDAYLIVRERIPLPSVCGHVCFAPCELRCRRSQLDEPVAVRALKRAAVEQGAAAEPLDRALPPPTGKRVAVVGSGPAGLTAAYYLARKGHQVTVLEELSEPGGMLRWGIPAYRLPPEALRTEIDRVIVSAGVEIHTGVHVESLAALKAQGFDAVFVAIGAHQGMRMDIPGEDDPAVYEAVDLLRRVAAAERPDMGRHVAVVGGGNTAVDAARTALRLGVDRVDLLYRRSPQEMPADPAEVAAAVEEGVRLRFLTLPTEVHRHDGQLELRCVQMRLGAADESGRRRPEPVPGSEFSLPVSSVIVAIGQRPAVPALLEVAVERRGRAVVDRASLACNEDGVFAGGDFVLGPATVIDAIAQGRRAATAIDRYLGGSGEIDETFVASEDLEALPPLGEGDDMVHRTHPVATEVPSRRRSFAEVEMAYCVDEAVREASRCLRCDLERRPDREPEAAGGD